jgi:hypothetical protein
VVPRLQKINPVGGHAINQPVFPRDSSAPASGKFVPERLGLADACEWIGYYRLDKFKGLQRSLSVILDEPGQIFPKQCQEVDPSLKLLLAS